MLGRLRTTFSTLDLTFALHFQYGAVLSDILPAGLTEAPLSVTHYGFTTTHITASKMTINK